jgi:hypothetical protein
VARKVPPPDPVPIEQHLNTNHSEGSRV